MATRTYGVIAVSFPFETEESRGGGDLRELLLEVSIANQ
jgi:hypothetical protein